MSKKEIKLSTTNMDMEEDLEKSENLEEKDKAAMRTIRDVVEALPDVMRGVDIANLCANIIAIYADDKDQVCEWCKEIHRIAHMAFEERTRRQIEAGMPLHGSKSVN